MREEGAGNSGGGKEGPKTMEEGEKEGPTAMEEGERDSNQQHKSKQDG